MSNKKDQHRRSVETLGLSGDGDEAMIAGIQALIQHHTPEQPYSYNTLLRIRSTTDEYLKKRGGPWGTAPEGGQDHA